MENGTVGSVQKNLGGTMDFLEYLFYESLPYLYAIVAFGGFMNHDVSKVAVVAAVVLSYCSYLVFSQRYFHRHVAPKRHKPLRF